MRRYLGFAAAACSLALLAGCNHVEDYRWKGTATIDNSDGNVPEGLNSDDVLKANISVFSSPPQKDAAASLSIKDLSDHAQAALVEALIKPGAKADDIRAAIGKPLAGAAGTSPILEGTYARLLVINFTAGLDLPIGDRVMKFWIVVKPVNFKFANYAQIAPVNVLTAVEHAQTQTTLASSITASPTPLPGLSSLGLTGSVNDQRTTTADVNEETNSISGTIQPDDLRIYRETARYGASNFETSITLSANDLDARFPEYVFHVSKLNLLDKNAKVLAPGAVTLEVVNDERPPRCDLIADVYAVYVLRHIESGAENNLEGRQSVSFQRHVITKTDQVIIPASSVRPTTWEIFSEKDAGKKSNPLRVSNALSGPAPLDFATYQDAHDFAGWLNKNFTWLKKQREPRIGKSGVFLTTGGEGVPLPDAPYRAAAVAAKADTAKCLPQMPAGPPK